VDKVNHNRSLIERYLTSGFGLRLPWACYYAQFFSAICWEFEVRLQRAAEDVSLQLGQRT